MPVSELQVSLNECGTGGGSDFKGSTALAAEHISHLFVNTEINFWDIRVGFGIKK